jgi:DNA-binding response OmpR family regulator
MKILVADDSATVRTQVRRALSEAGYAVVEAANGLRALQLADRERPSVIVLDIDMPYLDGFGVCQHLRQMGAPWNTTPIVFLTSAASHALELLGGQLGAYVQKPVSAERLLEVVGELVARQSGRRPEVAAGALANCAACAS